MNRSPPWSGHDPRGPQPLDGCLIEAVLAEGGAGPPERLFRLATPGRGGAKGDGAQDDAEDQAKSGADLFSGELKIYGLLTHLRLVWRVLRVLTP